MSRLRQTILEYIRIAGNYSGCHQIPERSFFLNGKQFPVCARCTGVAIGQLTAVLTAPFHFTNPAVNIILILIMGFDWFIQQINIRKSTNVRRLITGFCGGFGLFSLYITLIKFFIKGRHSPT